jgi:Uncharacterized membrane-associated protein/domain
MTGGLGGNMGTVIVAVLGAVLVAGGGVAVWYIWVVGGRAEAPSETPTGPAPTEPASDEDRIVRLLRENDGRMKQTRIVETTGWSKSKVSMLLSEMEQEGLVSKLQVGRENLISLPGEEPEAVGTSFDSE